jgi:hypothetical protein
MISDAVNMIRLGSTFRSRREVSAELCHSSFRFFTITVFSDYSSLSSCTLLNRLVESLSVLAIAASISFLNALPNVK